MIRNLGFLKFVFGVTLLGFMVSSVCPEQAVASDSQNPNHQASSPLSLPTLSQQMNILVIGIDNEKKKARFVGARADALMLVSLVPATHKVSVVSIPRDTRVRLDGRNQKINGTYVSGGPGTTARAVSASFGVPIDRYVVFDSVALKQLCRAVGPIGLNVEKEMNYTDRSGKLRIDLKPGEQKLNPSQVEQYVRFRKDGDADIGRIKRQQNLVRTAFNSLADPIFLLKLPQLVWTAYQQVKTNLTLDEMGRVALFMIGNGRPELSTFSLPGKPAYIRGVSYWLVDKDEARAIFDRAIAARKYTAI